MVNKRHNKLDICKLIGEMCKQLREENGVDIMNMAYYTNYTYANIDSFEKGKINNLYLFVCYLFIFGKENIRDVLLLLTDVFNQPYFSKEEMDKLKKLSDKAMEDLENETK